MLFCYCYTVNTQKNTVAYLWRNSRATEKGHPKSNMWAYQKQRQLVTQSVYDEKLSVIYSLILKGRVTIDGKSQP